MYKVISPLAIQVTKKKKMILNLNNYRNLFFRLLNIAKINYKELVKDQLKDLPEFKELYIIYRVFKGDKRRCDVGNVVSVHQKFFEDALVETGHLPDDDYKHIKVYTGVMGGIDKDNPRVEVLLLNKKEFLHELSTILKS
jgi:hypothetical protein